MFKEDLISLQQGRSIEKSSINSISFHQNNYKSDIGSIYLLIFTRCYDFINSQSIIWTFYVFYVNKCF